MITLKISNKNVDIGVPELDLGKWREYSSLLETICIDEILYSILQDLDCSRVFSSGRPMATNYPMYITLIEKYLFFANKINNQFEYAGAIADLNERPDKNLLFETTFKLEHAVKDKSPKKEKAIPNKYVREETTDMFTGKVTYIYENLRTKDIVRSNNPNLLDELNHKKPKVKRYKYSVPIEHITFSFNNKT
jgi:hypothetical protein